ISLSASARAVDSTDHCTRYSPPPLLFPPLPRAPPTSTPLPYTTLFRSADALTSRHRLDVSHDRLPAKGRAEAREVVPGPNRTNTIEDESGTNQVQARLGKAEQPRGVGSVAEEARDARPDQGGAGIQKREQLFSREGRILVRVGEVGPESFQP